MKGLYEVEFLRRAAPLAVTYWKAKFEERKAAWIAETAEKKVGWFRKRPIGVEKATEYFDASWSFDDCAPYYAEGGVWWFEASRVETSEYLVSLSERPGCVQFILNQKEIATLHPVVAEAEEPAGGES